MTGKQHKSIGAGLGILLAISLPAVNIIDALVIIFFSILGSLYPDIDTFKSKYKSIVFHAAYIFTVNSIFYYCCSINHNNILYVFLFVVLSLYGLCTKHRSTTHSILYLFLYSFPLYKINNHIGYSFSIGYLSHLLADNQLSIIPRKLKKKYKIRHKKFYKKLK